MSQYFDDTAFFAEYDLNSLRMYRYPEWFYSVSGLKIKVDKTKAVQLGGDGDNRIKNQCTNNLKLQMNAIF